MKPSFVPIHHAVIAGAMLTALTPAAAERIACEAPVNSSVCVVTPAPSHRKWTLLRGTVLGAEKASGEGSIYQRGSVLINPSGTIACVGCDCGAPAGLKPYLLHETAKPTIIDCGDAVISPGLINTHDHAKYNTAKSPTYSPIYKHRHEWRTLSDDELKASQTTKLPDPPANNSEPQLAWGALRHFLMGTTANSAGEGFRTPFLRDLALGKDNGRIPHVGEADFATFPLGDGASGSRRNGACDYVKNSNRTPSTLPTVDDVKKKLVWLPHVSEGINKEARQEFLCLQAIYQSDQIAKGKLGLVHGVALKLEDAKILKSRESNVVWSPRSNLSLYANTAPVVMFDFLGINIALASDWTPSGSINLQREVACAKAMNDERFQGHFTDYDFWKMVTINAAKAAGVSDLIGELAAGKYADLAVYFSATPTTSPYTTVLTAAPQAVDLVMRGGVPLYGDALTMAALGNTGCDELDVCGQSHRLCTVQETGSTWAQLRDAAGFGQYGAFECTPPTTEPKCIPSLPAVAPDDLDGDGIKNKDDLCPSLYSPLRAVDDNLQPDGDRDRLGDVCDPCPDDAANACPAASTDKGRRKLVR